MCALHAAESSLSQEVRLVLVEDHPIVRAGLISELSRMSNLKLCGIAETVQKARALIREEAPQIVLLDLLLGDQGELGDTLTLISEWRSTAPGMKILVVSGLLSEIYHRRALKAGAHGVFMKREATQQLPLAIEAVLAGEIWISPRMTGSDGSTGQLIAGPWSERLGRLTNRELHVFHAIALGQSNRHIAEDLGISVKTVETYKEHLKEKLAVPHAEALRQLARSYLRESWQ
jgi:DNA-binding NarL/FixJ family response regulator